MAITEWNGMGCGDGREYGHDRLAMDVPSMDVWMKEEEGLNSGTKNVRAVTS
jgi:hypothetical protein